MPYDRYHRQRPLWVLGSGAETIMAPSSDGETHSADDLAVTARGSLFLAILVLPLVLITGVRDSVTLAALAMAISTVAAGTRVAYRRVRRI